MEEIFDNYEVKMAARNSTEDIISGLETKADVNQVLVPPIEGEDLKTPAQSVIPSMLWFGTVLTSFVIWTICIVSLVLNIVRKNTGKAVFSGIAFVIPIIDIILATMGRAAEAVFITIFAFFVQLVTLIVLFIFCFSKNKNVTNNKNNVQ